MKTKISHIGVASLVLVSAFFVPACMRSTGRATTLAVTIGSYDFNSGDQVFIETSSSFGVFYRIDRTTPDLIEVGVEQITNNRSDITIVRGSYQFCFAKNRRGRFRMYVSGGGGVATEQLNTGTITSAVGELGLGMYLHIRGVRLEARVNKLELLNSDNVQDAIGLTFAVGF